MYHDRTALCFLWAKNMVAAKDIYKEMLPILAEFVCGYPLLHPYFLPTKNAQRYSIVVHVFRSAAIL
jgi:hypothetical protein